VMVAGHVTDPVCVMVVVVMPFVTIVPYVVGLMQKEAEDSTQLPLPLKVGL
jgi:hypothetical protein